MLFYDHFDGHISFFLSLGCLLCYVRYVRNPEGPICLLLIVILNIVVFQPADHELGRRLSSHKGLWVQEAARDTCTVRGTRTHHMCGEIWCHINTDWDYACNIKKSQQWDIHGMVASPSRSHWSKSCVQNFTPKQFGPPTYWMEMLVLLNAVYTTCLSGTTQENEKCKKSVHW